MRHMTMIVILAAALSGCASTGTKTADAVEAVATSETGVQKRVCHREKAVGTHLGMRVCRHVSVKEVAVDDALSGSLGTIRQ